VESIASIHDHQVSQTQFHLLLSDLETRIEESLEGELLESGTKGIRRRLRTSGRDLSISTYP
jgi:hypothetical protein